MIRKTSARRCWGQVAFTLLVACSASATVPRLPVLTEKEFRGRWEGISAENRQAFVLDLRDDGKSSVIMSSGSPLAPYVWVHRVESLNVDANGCVQIKARDPESGRILVRGCGRAKYPVGTLDAVIEIGGETDGFATKTKVNLRLDEISHFDVLRALMKASENAVVSSSIVNTNSKE
jgi:hypothetical protein